MLILISCAKIMRECHGFSRTLEAYSDDFSEPRFGDCAAEIAARMAQFDVDFLADNLKVNRAIAAQNLERYDRFGGGEGSLWPAIFSYHGIVFKSIAPEDFSPSDMLYAQNHLLITSFLYGLLRPLDLIEHYRLEGKFPLNFDGHKTAFSYWKAHLTDVLIEAVRQNGGVLMNLASGEMKDLFDWKRVCREVEVLSPEFYEDKDGRLKNIVVYTKIARGLMTRYILKNRVEDAATLRDFSDGGYRFAPDTDSGVYRFVRSHSQAEGV